MPLPTTLLENCDSSIGATTSKLAIPGPFEGRRISQDAVTHAFIRGDMLSEANR